MKWTITGLAAMALIPSLALAQQTTTDSSTSNQSSQDTTRVHGAAEGRLATRSRSRAFGLSSDQVKELQQAINQNGCNAGSADGQFGRQTREGIDCIRHAKNIQSRNINDVLRALNLSFTASDSMAARNQSQSGVTNAKTGHSTLGPNVKRVGPTGVRDTTGARSDTTGAQSDTTMRSDTTGAAGARSDTTGMQRDTSTMRHDTSGMSRDTSGMSRDTSMMHRDTTGMSRDTTQNQSQSGVTNAKTGRSKLGPNIKHERPTGIRDSTSRDTSGMSRDTSMTHGRDTSTVRRPR
jgi:hypothetical protein